MIKEIKQFNIKQIADSGQCFRMNPIKGEYERQYGLIAYGKFLKLIQIDECHIDFSCSEEEYNSIWHSYFHLDYDYETIVESLQNGEDQFLKEASQYGKGIRILRQEPFEALISFIISQNKNIPAIKSSIEKISKRYGNPITIQGSEEIYYSFPTPEALASASNEDLRQCGLGYRDEYIIRTSKSITNNEINLEALIHQSHTEGIDELLKLHGVGIKVANCVSLFGLNNIDAFPIDTWIKKILKEIYDDKFDVMKYDGYAGIVQQYMFYYMRVRNNKI